VVMSVLSTGGDCQAGMEIRSYTHKQKLKLLHVIIYFLNI